MSSSRLPGKIMLDLAGKPVIWHVLHRLRQSKTISQIILATTTDPGDDVLADYAQNFGVEVVRGPRDNVLARFVLAVDRFDPDYIVRVTSDCPLIDARAIDDLVEVLIRDHGDYSGWIPDAPTLHGGFEPFTRDLFQRIVDEGADHPVAQEHVFGYLSVNPGLGRKVGIPAPPNHIFDHPRLWLDTPADLVFLRTLYARTGAPPGEIDVDEVADLLRADPGLCAINAHVHQKSAAETSRNIIIRCDGTAALGMGHVVRMVALAKQLRERHAIAVHFAVQPGAQASRLLNAAHFPHSHAPDGVDEAAWIDALIKELGADAVVLDIRTDLPGRALDQWREDGVVSVLIDDIGTRLNHADVVFCPPTPKTLALDTSSVRPEIHVGWAWVIVPDAFAKTPPQKIPPNLVPRVLITCGASDPGGFTRLALNALEALNDDLIIDVVMGPLMVDPDPLVRAAARHRHPVMIHHIAPGEPQKMAALMARADVGIVAFGVTAAEMAAMDLTAVYLCLSPDHAASASVYEQAGFGIVSAATPNAIRTAVTAAVHAPRFHNPKLGPQVDNLGAVRIAARIVEHITPRK